MVGWREATQTCGAVAKATPIGVKNGGQGGAEIGRELKMGKLQYTVSPLCEGRRLRYGDGVADAAEGVVAAVAAVGGDDEVVFAAGDWVVEDNGLS